jgi:energy-converting hydrogenase Eha subunit F
LIVLTLDLVLLVGLHLSFLHHRRTLFPEPRVRSSTPS